MPKINIFRVIMNYQRNCVLSVTVIFFFNINLRSNINLFQFLNIFLKKGQASRIQAAEMRFLRHMAGYTLHDHRRNTGIRQELNVMSLSLIHI